MKKASILALASFAFAVSCNSVNDSTKTSSKISKSSNIQENTSSDGQSNRNNVIEKLNNFIGEASYAYSIKAVVNQETNYYGLKTQASNYLDVAGKDDYFSITKYSQVFDNMGSINRNSVDSDLRYKSYDYEGKNVVSSSYLNLANEICYTVHKDNYGYTTEWDTSFKSFFTVLTPYSFTTDDDITYSLKLQALEDEDLNMILYQLGCLSVSSTTGLHVKNVSLIKENNSFKKISFTFVDDTDSNAYESYTIAGDIVVGDEAVSDVKVEETATGNEIKELSTAFKKLANYNFDFSLKVTISRNVYEEYGATAKADGTKIISDKFAYIESDDGLEYYTSPISDSKVYKTMNTISSGKLATILPSFDISTYFFTKAATNTYILSNKAKRCSVSSKELSVYQPFGLSFSSLTIKLGENEVEMSGIDATYQYDISYTNIGKTNNVEFTSSGNLGYGDYLNYYAWSYEDYIDQFQTQLGLDDVDSVYEVMNNIPTFYSYNMDGTPSFIGYKFNTTSTTYGIQYKYNDTSKRDVEIENILSFYLENGFSKYSDNQYTTLVKTITFNEKELLLGLRILSLKNYEIPVIGVFPIIIE